MVGERGIVTISCPGVNACVRLLQSYETLLNPGVKGKSLVGQGREKADSAIATIWKDVRDYVSTDPAGAAREPDPTIYIELTNLYIVWFF